MRHTAIKVENLSKRYTLGAKRAESGNTYDTFRDAIVRSLRRPLSLGRANAEPAAEFLALNGVSFEVRQGDVVGIIGRNGAGKSTMLKILSRIIDPTAGRVALRGRVASLLEVGTGFHPELTGRENIFLNGVILGMTRAEIRAKLDPIVAFAEIESFVDTPVKHYSSGMYVRLAFAVAAHLEPQILILDEVLAVGDAAFQAKCLLKMKQVASEEGRTIILVSHDLRAIEKVTTRCLLFQNGRLTLDGSSREAVAEYRRSSETDNTPSGQPISIDGFILSPLEIEPVVLSATHSATFRFELVTQHSCILTDLQLVFSDHQDDRLFLLDFRKSNWPLHLPAGAKLNCILKMAKLCLNSGEYRIAFHARTLQCSPLVESFATITVVDGPTESGVIPHARMYLGKFAPDYQSHLSLHLDQE